MSPAWLARPAHVSVSRPALFRWPCASGGGRPGRPCSATSFSEAVAAVWWLSSRCTGPNGLPVSSSRRRVRHPGYSATRTPSARRMAIIRSGVSGSPMCPPSVVQLRIRHTPWHWGCQGVITGYGTSLLVLGVDGRGVRLVVPCGGFHLVRLVRFRRRGHLMRAGRVVRERAHGRGLLERGPRLRQRGRMRRLRAGLGGDGRAGHAVHPRSAGPQVLSVLSSGSQEGGGSRTGPGSGSGGVLIGRAPRCWCTG